MKTTTEYLMKRHIEHIAALEERLLGTIPVVNVNVDNRHSVYVGPVGPQGDFSRDRHIVNQAETVALIPLCMVARRSHQRIGILHAAGEHCLHGSEQAAAGECRNGESPGPLRDGLWYNEMHAVGGDCKLQLTWRCWSHTLVIVRLRRTISVGDGKGRSSWRTDALLCLGGRAGRGVIEF